MFEGSYVISDKNLLLEKNCLTIVQNPCTKVYFIEALCQLAKLRKRATPEELIIIEQIAGDILAIQTTYVNDNILSSFHLDLQQGE